MGKAVRLDKFLAEAGAGARSEVKRFIQKGRVQVNGTVVKRPEEKVDPQEDRIVLDGAAVEAQPEFVYYLLHKPAGCVSAARDSRDRTVLDYVPSGRRGLFPVGRLDKDTEGLLMITDDGGLAHALLSPKRHVEKTYFVRAEGLVTPEDIKALEQGVDIGDEKPTLPARAELLRTDPEENCSELLLTICEGRYHQVKRMLSALGKKVVYLRRLSMGPLVLPEDLPRGACRPLTGEELEKLRDVMGK